MIKVLVLANSMAQLVELETLVRSAKRLQLVGCSLGGHGLRQQLGDVQPDVLLAQSLIPDLDQPPSRDGDGGSVPTVVLAAEAEFGDALNAIRSTGSEIRGILPVWASAREIQIAIEAAAGGLLVLHPDVAEHMQNTFSFQPRAADPVLERLSPREKEILNLLAAGLSNKEIARRLEISEHTVKFHVTSIFNKLNASSRAEAVAIGIRQGLLAL